ncbi:MAG: sugar phosphate isomerase/epimerase family protein [bacterium]|nr:sugar phosphate isomerase/epimerase family protein [bacterium]
MTVLGLGSYGVAWAIGVPGFEAPAQSLDAFGLVRFAHELGLRLVQIADNLPLHALSSAERAALKAEADRLGVTIEVGTRGIQPEHLMHYIAIAQEFHSPILRVVVDTAEHHPSAQEVVDLLRPRLSELTGAGITLAIENHDRFQAQTLADIISTLDHPNVGICLDTVNSFGAMEGPAVVLAALGPHVVNLHVKEFVIRRLSHNMGFIVTGVPAGQGMLDVPWLLDELRRYGRDFNAIIETWLSPEDTMQATVEKEAQMVQQSTAYLRTLIAE